MTLNNNPVIPLHIYQTWNTKNLPKYMAKCVDTLKKANPEFTYHLYDDNECREFIKNNFDKEVLDAYDTLIPTAYKADLWRYCVLYKNGGIYLDIKFRPVNGFKFITLTDKDYYVLDRPYENNNTSIQTELNIINNPNYYENVYNNIDTLFWKNKQIGIYNALLICRAGNKLLLDCINSIVKHCKEKYYGHNCLYISGPGLMSDLYINGDKEKYKEFSLFHPAMGKYILDKNGVILEIFPEYRQEQKQNSSIPHYHIL